MAKISKEDVIEFISNISVLELSELIKEMEEKFGVSAAAPAAVMAVGPAGDPHDPLTHGFLQRPEQDPDAVIGNGRSVGEGVPALEGAHTGIIHQCDESRAVGTLGRGVRCELKACFSRDAGSRTQGTGGGRIDSTEERHVEALGPEPLGRAGTRLDSHHRRVEFTRRERVVSLGCRIASQDGRDGGGRPGLRAAGAECGGCGGRPARGGSII